MSQHPKHTFRTSRLIYFRRAYNARSSSRSSMALSLNRSRAFVVTVVAVMIGLPILATVLITCGMNYEQLQEQVRQLEEADCGA